MKQTRKKRLDGIDYTLQLMSQNSSHQYRSGRNRLCMVTAYRVYAETEDTGLLAIHSPGRWVLMGNGGRREFRDLPSLFKTIAWQVHG